MKLFVYGTLLKGLERDCFFTGLCSFRLLFYRALKQRKVNIASYDAIKELKEKPRIGVVYPFNIKVYDIKIFLFLYFIKFWIVINVNVFRV